MKYWKSSMLVIGLFVLVVSCFTASAESVNDGTGDVWHWSQTGTAWAWAGNVGDKPNIDIKEISYTVSGDKLTLKMEVAESIQSSEKIWYWMYYNSTDSTYNVYWVNGTGIGMAMKQGALAEYTQNITVTDDTITAIFNVAGDTTNVDLWGYAAEYTTVGSQTTEWWGDWAPNTRFPGQTSNDNTPPGGNNNGTSPSSTKTPGFEIFACIAAITIAAILIRRRR